MQLFGGGEEFAKKKDIFNPNLLSNSKGVFQPQNNNADNWEMYPNSTAYLEQNQTYTISGKTNGVWSGTHNSGVESNKCVIWFVDNKSINTIVSSDNQVNNSNQFVWTEPTGTYFLRVNCYKTDNSIKAWDIKVERGTVATPYIPAGEDLMVKSDFDALKAKEDNIAENLINYVPHVNLLRNSAGPFFPQPDPNNTDQTVSTDVNAIDQWQNFTKSTVTLVKGETYTFSATTNGIFSNVHDPSKASNKCVVWIGKPANIAISGENTSVNTFTWDSDTGTYPIRVNRYGADSTVKCWNLKIEHGNQATDWTPCPLDS